MSEFVKCKNPNCIVTIERVMKGGHWKKFCSSKCRSQYHSGTSSKYATPRMTNPTIGKTIEETFNYQVHNAVGQVSGRLTDRLVAQITGKLDKHGIPIPYYTLGAVGVSQLVANLFGVKQTKTRISMAKWFGLFGAALDYTFAGDTQRQHNLPPSPEEAKALQANQANQAALRAKNGDFVSALDYRKIEIPTIAMSPEYDYLFGMPSRDFYMVIHGLPGNGKTSFAVKFSQYFHKHHGKVLYLASEQSGIDLSLQDILKKNKATFSIHTNPRQLTEEHLLAAFKNYDLIILDSATDLGFYPSEVKKLQEQSGKALISILQSTKDGGFKGSQEWLHDVDISLKISNYEAVLEKTRFKTSNRKTPTKGTTIPI